MGIVSDRLKYAMELRNMRQSDLVEKTGINKSSISTYLSGEYQPKQTNTYKLARALDVNPAWLLGEDVDMIPASSASYRHTNLIPIDEIINGHRVPVIGATAAGTPIVADREWDEYIPAPDGRGRADAALRIEGDSMEPHYLDGDYVYIRYQDDVEDGQVAAVCIDDTVTLKKVYHIPNGIYLVSENAARYPPMTYTTDEVNNIHLLGLAVGFFRWEH